MNEIIIHSVGPRCSYIVTWIITVVAQHTQLNGTTYVQEMIAAAMSWRDIITSIDRIEEQKRKKRQQGKMPRTEISHRRL